MDLMLVDNVWCGLCVVVRTVGTVMFVVVVVVVVLFLILGTDYGCRPDPVP